MSERKRFHPLALAIYGFNGLKRLLFVIFLLIVNGELTTTFGILVLLAVFLFVTAQSLWKYFSQSYQISSEKIILYQGVFRKRETDIPYERIQTIKQRQWFFFKPFNTIQLLIETAGGDSTKAEASMPAVNFELLELIESYRQGEQPESDHQVLEDSVEKPAAVASDYRVTNSQIILFAVTDLSIIASFIALIFFVTEFIPENWITTATSLAENVWRTGWLVTIAILVVTLIIVMLLSLVKTFIQYYNFQVKRTNHTLTIESGLFERKIQKIPLEKIQGLKVRQQPLRKILGISSVELLLAGGQESEGENGEVKKLYILPIISDTELYTVLNQLMLEWNFKRPEIGYVSRQKLWYFWRWKLLLIPVAVGVAFLNRWIALAVVIILLLSLLLSWFNCRTQGYHIQSANRVCIQDAEWFTKVHTFVERQKVQSFSEETSRWLFPKQIGHVSMTLKAGLAIEVLNLRFMDFSHVQKLKNFYQTKL